MEALNTGVSSMHSELKSKVAKHDFFRERGKNGVWDKRWR